MAGIGFELKKLFAKKGIFNSIRAVGYSTLTTVGPMIMTILVIIVLQIVFRFSELPYFDRDLIAGSISYVFIFALVVTSPINAVLSRYTADMIYEEKHQHVLPSYYLGITMALIIAGILGIPFAYIMITRGNLSLFYVIMLYVMYMLMAIVFVTMTYISLLKEYRKVAMAFVVGMIITFTATALLILYGGQSFVIAIILGFNIGYIYIIARLFTFLKMYVPNPSKEYKAIFGYFTKYFDLFLSNLGYILGLYAHNFVFWNSNLRITVANSLVMAPSYDLASFIAMLASMSFTVVFVVKVETSFYDKYSKYCHMLTGGSKKDIDNSRVDMFYTLSEEMTGIVKFQVLFSAMFILLSYILFPYIGMGGVVESIFPSLAVAYILVAIMYSYIVVLFYVDGGKYAAITGWTFAVTTALASIFVMQNMTPEFYGLGVFVGAICGFTVVSFRLKYLQKHMDKNVFTSGRIIDTRILARRNREEKYYQNTKNQNQNLSGGYGKRAKINSI